MPKSAYIHIPYCNTKCHYCSFVSFCTTKSITQYLKILSKEINTFYEGEKLSTLYLGGGTPSILTPEQINSILALFKKNSECEITIELNPENLSYDYLSKLYDTGVNRISLGCQTFNDDILKKINRRHNCKKVIKSVKDAQKIGFNNISLDFIYGLPEQKLNGFIEDLKKALFIGIQHISLYGLKIEEGCYFYKNPPENLPDDDIQAEMYLKAIEYLLSQGFEHYEVSNFSYNSLYSKHNTAYWKNQEYYGFGVAAHGYKNGIRYENSSNLSKYLKSPLEKFNEHKLSEKEKLEEEVFLGFRLIEGINTSNINHKYNIDFEKIYKHILEKYLKLNLIQKTSKGYALTPNGILVSNVVLADFLLD